MQSGGCFEGTLADEVSSAGVFGVWQQVCRME
jgi:hypothetical protein